MKGGLGHSGEGKEIQRLLPQSAAPFTWWPSPAPIWISLPAVWAPGWMSLDLPHLHHGAPHRHGPPRTALQDVGAQPAKTAGCVQISYILRWVSFLADLTESSVQVRLSP